MRAGDIGQRMRMRGRTHTGFVREETALRTLADRGLQGITEAAADDGLRLEGVAENHREGRRQILDAQHEHRKAADQEHERHHRHDLLGHGREALDIAEEDGTAEDHEGNADDPRRHTERGTDRRADRVGLHHAAEEAEREDDRHREEASEELTEVTAECGRDVVDRAAVDTAVLTDHSRLLREDRLRVDGGHAEEGDDPHPEDRTRAAGEDRTTRADDVAGADLCRDGGREGLEGGHAGGVLLTGETQLTEGLLHPIAEVADLDEAGPDGVPETHAEKQDHENIVGQIGIDCLDK